jgi:lactoylglutathione lyase
MRLSSFSVSLTVKDLAASKSFYEGLSFDAIGGNERSGWLIIGNETTTIGLFQGMFEKNILTFNPGWDANGQPLEDFTDVRDMQKQLKRQGYAFESEADESTSGPASCIIVDPDGNSIILDQHI